MRAYEPLGVASLALALFSAGAAHAACTVDATGAVAFGAYDSVSPTPTDSAGTITYTCTSIALITLSTGSSGTYASRTVRSGANILNYNLYADAARTQVWGDFTGGTTIRIVGAGTGAVVNVYGRMPAGQGSSPGAYSDSIVVTFFF